MAALSALVICHRLVGAAPTPGAPTSRVQAEITTPLRLDRPMMLTLALDATQRAALRDPRASGTRARRWRLRVEGLAAPAADLGVHVYLGLPGDRPRLDRAHRAGAFAFYPSGEPPGPFTLDAGAALGRLRASAAAGETWEALRVTLVLVRLRAPSDRAGLDEVALAVQRVSLALE